MIGGLSVGMPGLAEHRSIGEDLELCARLGLDFIEINANLPHLQPDRLNLPALRSRLGETGLYLTFHAEEDLSPFHFNSRIAAAWLDTLAAEIETACTLGSPIVNLHLNEGVYFTLPGQRLYLFEAFKDHFLEGIEALRSLCIRVAGSSGPVCCVENCGGFPPFLREGIDRLLESPEFGLTWDVGHDHAAGGVDRPFLMDRADRVRHMHLHDAGPAGNHLAAGEGVLDLGARLAFAREHRCRVVLETKTGEALARTVQWVRAWAGGLS
ncbi:MAG: sugar phosphate isomerase/epimerase [Clostridia bacterium]|nr:sugar phosphate isomerase/epimerase [Clostridia bacterium]